MVAIGAASATNQLTASVGVSPNQLITIEVRQGLVVIDRYYVRCLPPDFPVIKTIAYGTATPGWYLVTPGTFGPGSHYAVIVDERGVPVWYRKATTPILDLKRLAVGPLAGRLAWVPVLGQGFGVDPTRGYEIHELDGTLVRSVLTVGPPTDQHDLIALPNGNFALFAYEEITNVDVSVLGPGFTSNEDSGAGPYPRNRSRAHSCGMEAKITSTSRRARSQSVSSDRPPLVDLEHFTRRCRVQR